MVGLDGPQMTARTTCMLDKQGYMHAHAYAHTHTHRCAIFTDYVKAFHFYVIRTLLVLL